MALCAARGRMCAGTRSGNAASGVRVSPSLLPFRGEGDELCRLWSPELAWLPCPESLACPKASQSRGVSQDDRGGYTPVSSNGSGGQTPCRTAAHDPGIKHNNLPLRAAQSSSETARIRG